MSSREGYGQRRVIVTPEVFEAWLVNGNAARTDLPEDARFVNLWPPKDGDTRNTYTLIFESSEWDEVPEGADIPKQEVRVEEVIAPS